MKDMKTTGKQHNQTKDKTCYNCLTNIMLNCHIGILPKA